jgi:hypothetical protein
MAVKFSLLSIVVVVVVVSHLYNHLYNIETALSILIIIHYLNLSALYYYYYALIIIIIIIIIIMYELKNCRED